MDWFHAIPENLFHRIIATCILLYAPIAIFRRTYIPAKRMRAVNLRITADSLRSGVTLPQMTDDERRKCNRFWLLRSTLPILAVTVICLSILWQDILLGR